MQRCHDIARRSVQVQLFVLVLVATTIFLGQSAKATTTLLVDGTFANFADQLTLDFVLPDFSPFADANMKFRTYQSSGGSASPSPGNTISPGGMDSVIDLYGPSGYIAGSDDITGSLDSELRTSGFSGAAGATVISPLLGGDHDLVLRNFGEFSLGNGTFALNALSTTGAFFIDQGFSVNGLTGTAGVSINRILFGQLGAGVPPKLNSDSPADALNANTLQFFGNYEWNLSDGSVFMTNLYDGALNAVWGGGGAGEINISGGTLYAQTQYWGADRFHSSVINQSGGSNSSSAYVAIGYSSATDSSAVYKLSGSGVLDTDDLQIGSLMTAAGTAQFLQSGGTAHADSITIGSTATTAENALYRLTGGTASMEYYGFLSINGGGTFELSGGTLELTTVNQIQVGLGGVFNWLSGTLQLDSFTLDSTAGVLAPTLTLGPGRTLEVLGTTTINTVLTLSGGGLITETIEGPGALVLDSGELRITNSSGLNVDSAGPLGANVTVKPGLFLNVPAGMSVTGGSALMVQDGGRVAAFVLTNNAGGLIQLGGPSARIEGVNLFNSGVVSGNGIIDQQLSNLSGGEVSVSSGQTLRFINASAGHENEGSLRLAGGELLLAGTLTNKPTGRIEGRGVLRTGGLTNQGHVALSSGIADVFGDVVNNTGSATTGITVSGNADATFWDDVNNVAGSLFRVSAGSSATFFGTLSGAGVSGPGSVYLEADVTPGASPATATFGGKLYFGPNSRLVIELAGTLLGSYDQLHVSDQLSLDGTLQVSLVDPFSPAAGNEFDILDWGTLAGTFSSLNLPNLGADLMWNASQLYTAGVLKVYLAGDYNGNGIVDAADYTVWRNALGQIGAGLAADGDASGMIDAGDYDAWKMNFGNVAASGSGAGTNAAVPEPATLVMFLVGMTTMLYRRRVVV